MRAIINILLLLVLAIPTSGMEVTGSWIFSSKGGELIRIYCDKTFYSIIIEGDGPIVFYGVGTYELKSNKIVYSYETIFPNKGIAKGAKDEEVIVLNKHDKLELKTSGMGTISFTKLMVSEPGNMDLKKIKEPIEDMSSVDELPRQLSGPKPYYPYEMKRRGVKGIVLEEIVIDTKGKVVAARSLTSSGELFASSVASVVYQFKYKPCTKDRKAVFVRFIFPFIFAMKGD